MAETLEQRLIRHEGLRLRPYHDTRGYLTIGVGRCLDTEGVSEAEAMLMLGNDIARCRAALGAALSWFGGLDSARQDVLVEMAFQLGVRGLLAFHRTLAAIEAGDYAAAAAAMAQSAWAHETPARVRELAAAMRG